MYSGTPCALKLRCADSLAGVVIDRFGQDVMLVPDGAGYFTVFRKVILPLIRPAIATVIVMSFQSVWNNTETSAMYTTRESMRTLTFFLNTLAGSNNTVAGQGMAAASSFIMFLPNLILFLIMQSRVMNTMAYSGIK